MTSAVALGLPTKDSLTAVMDELKNHEFAAIGSEVVDFVGGARGLPENPAVAEGELIDAGLSFLISLMKPLQDCLNQVTGDASSLNGRAEQWKALAAGLRATVPRVEQLATSTRASWTGAAAVAFDSTMHEFTATVTGAAAACDGVVLLLQTSADLMSGAQSLIVDVIGQVIEYMIAAEAAAAASAAFTFGASEAVAQASIIGEVASGVEKSISVVDRVGALLERIANALENVGAVFAKVATLLERLAKQTGALVDEQDNPDAR